MKYCNYTNFQPDIFTNASLTLKRLRNDKHLFNFWIEFDNEKYSINQLQVIN